MKSFTLFCDQRFKIVCIVRGCEHGNLYEYKRLGIVNATPKRNWHTCASRRVIEGNYWTEQNKPLRIDK